MRKRRRLEPVASVNLIPLIDVLLLIIIFFMVTTTFKLAQGIKLDLPSSSTSKDITSSVLKISVESESVIYVDKARTDLDRLPDLLKQRTGSGDPSQLQAIVEGDKSVTYQLMVYVLDALRKNGIESVGLRTRVGQAAP
jgi:biopolymer transport protein ExbD